MELPDDLKLEEGDDGGGEEEGDEVDSNDGSDGDGADEPQDVDGDGDDKDEEGGKLDYDTYDSDKSMILTMNME